MGEFANIEPKKICDCKEPDLTANGSILPRDHGILRCYNCGGVLTIDKHGYLFNIKKEWSKPKLFDLQVNGTEGGKGGGFYEDTHYVPGQGGFS